MEKTSTPKPLVTKDILDSKLNSHFLVCSAFVGTAALMTAQNAGADIVYSGLMNLTVPTTNGLGGVYLDIETSGIVFPRTNGTQLTLSEKMSNVLPGWDVNFYFNPSGNVTWYYNGSYAVANGANHVAAFGGGVLIDGSAALGTRQTMFPEYQNTTAYMGVSFLDHNDATRYGWIRVTGGNPGAKEATIVDWAYEDSGAGILTGAGVPEPGTMALGCLAAGALGVTAWRNRKKS